MSWEPLVVALAAFACGVVNALAGGGSLLLFPALVATGMGALPANVTNAVSTLPGYVGSTIGFRAELRELRHHLVPLVGAAVVGSAVGCGLLLATSDAVFDTVAPALVAVAAVLVGLQPLVRARAARRHRRAMAPGAAGVLAGTVYGGYFGGGLGVVLLAVLGATVDEPLGRLNAVKAGLSVVNGTVAVLVFSAFGPVRWQWVALTAPLTLLGGYAGSHLSRNVDEGWLRWSVVVLGLAVAAAMALT